MKFHQLTINKIVRETEDAISVQFNKPDTFNFKAGQYLTLRKIENGVDLRRSYSLSSSPNDNFLQITIKKVKNGVFSNLAVDSFKEGDILESYPPQGHFIFTPEDTRIHHYILIAGGSGITPMLSIIKSLIQNEPFSKISLLYSNWDEKSIIFNSELKELESNNRDKLFVKHILSDANKDWKGEKGMIEGDFGKKIISELIDRFSLPFTIYLCGPTGLMDNVFEITEKLKISKSQIHKEAFTTSKIQDDEVSDISLIDREVLVLLGEKHHTIKVSAGQTILEAALKAKLEPPYACQEGTCCTCRALLVSGSIQLNEREGLSDEELKEGYILTCQSLPLSENVEVEFG